MKKFVFSLLTVAVLGFSPSIFAGVICDCYGLMQTGQWTEVGRFTGNVDYEALNACINWQRTNWSRALYSKVTNCQQWGQTGPVCGGGVYVQNPDGSIVCSH